jgi:uncharacterized membrane protein
LNALPATRLLLALAYPWIAHAASERHDGALAAIALGDIALIVLLEPLAQRRAWAWGLAVVLGVGLWFFARTPHALLPLMLVPVAIVALVSWTFGRTLRLGRVPLITRIVCAMDKLTPDALAPELRVYTRKLTATWAVSLGALALVDLVLALCAVPDGLLASAGIAPPLTLDRTQWSWFANGVNYGLVGALFVGEYAYRARRFPGRYKSFFDFLRRMAALGPAFWRDALRG